MAKSNFNIRGQNPRGGFRSITGAKNNDAEVMWNAKVKMNNREWSGRERINDRAWDGRERINYDNNRTKRDIVGNEEETERFNIKRRYDHEDKVADYNHLSDEDTREMIKLGVLTYNNGRLHQGYSKQPYVRNSKGQYLKYDDYAREIQEEKFGKYVDERLDRWALDHSMTGSIDPDRRFKMRSKMINKMMKKETKKRYKEEKRKMKRSKKLLKKWSK